MGVDPIDDGKGVAGGNEIVAHQIAVSVGSVQIGGAVSVGRQHRPGPILVDERNDRQGISRGYDAIDAVTSRVRDVQCVQRVVQRGFGLSIVIVNVDDGLVSLPPLAVPPLSCKRTVTVAVPWVFGAGVKVNVPLASICGGAANKPPLSVETLNVNS